MALGVFQATIVSSETGRPVPFTSLSVVNSETLLAPNLFSDKAGMLPITNPFTANENGFARFYAAPALYNITATGFSGAAAVWLDVVVSSTASGGSGGGGGGGMFVLNRLGGVDGANIKYLVSGQHAFLGEAPDNIYYASLVYNLIDGTSEIYQHYVIRKESGEENTGFSIAAIDGNYAILMEGVTGYGKLVAVSPYFTGVNIKAGTAIDAYDLSSAGGEVTLIAAGENYYIAAVLMIGKGLFAIIYKLSSNAPFPGTQHMIKIVGYENENTLTVNTMVFNISDYSTGNFFAAASPRAAVDVSTGGLLISFATFSGTDPDYTYGTLALYINTLTGEVIGDYQFDEDDVSALWFAGSPISESNIFEFDRTSPSYSTTRTSFLNVGTSLEGDNDSMDGFQIRKYSYSERTVGMPPDMTTIYGAQSYADIDMTAVIEAKLESLGFPIADPQYQRFGWAYPFVA